MGALLYIDQKDLQWTLSGQDIVQSKLHEPQQAFWLAPVVGWPPRWFSNTPAYP